MHERPRLKVPLSRDKEKPGRHVADQTLHARYGRPAPLFAAKRASDHRRIKLNELSADPSQTGPIRYKPSSSCLTREGVG